MGSSSLAGVYYIATYSASVGADTTEPGLSYGSILEAEVTLE